MYAFTASAVEMRCPGKRPYAMDTFASWIEVGEADSSWNMAIAPSSSLVLSPLKVILPLYRWLDESSAKCLIEQMGFRSPMWIFWPDALDLAMRPF